MNTLEIIASVYALGFFAMFFFIAYDEGDTRAVEWWVDRSYIWFSALWPLTALQITARLLYRRRNRK